MKKLNEKELEQFIHATLRALPDRRAPGTLESRVMAAVEQRAMIPWYHKSWSYWPAAFRGLFLTLATGVTGAVVTAFYLMLNGADTKVVAAQAGERLSFITNIYQVVQWIADLGAHMFSSIPSLWIYGGLALVASLYATFFGLGAVAYRTYFRNR